MRNACDKKIEHRSNVKVKVTENTKTTIWAITFEPEVVETSGWFQNVTCQNTYQNCRRAHYVRHAILRHVTSNKIYNCCIFSNFVNSEPIYLKIGTHIDLTCTIYMII